MTPKARLCSFALLLAFFLASSPLAAQDKVDFALDWVINGRIAPFFNGLDKGFYREAGIDITITRGYGSGDTVKRVAGGSNPYGIADTAAIVPGRSRGTMVKAIGIIHDRAPHTIFSLKKTGIRTPQDLKGKTLAAPLGSSVRILFPVFARVNGLDPEKDVTWLTVDGAAMPATLLSGRAHGLPNFLTDGPPLFAQAKAQGDEIASLRFSEWGVDLYATALISTDDLIRQRPDLARRLVGAALKSWAFAVENPEETLRMFLVRTPEASPEVTRQMLTIVLDLLLSEATEKHGIGWIERAKMEKTIEVLTQYLNLPRRVSAEEVYTNEFLPKLFPKRRS